MLGTLRDIGLDRLLGPARNRCRDLVIATIVARLIAPASKLATARMLDPLTAASSLGAVLGLGPVDEDELYVALDWLGERQQAIEKALARKHLHEGTLVLYDVSSSYLEGRCCELARLGYNRDGKTGKLQIVYGLLCAPDGERKASGASSRICRSTFPSLRAIVAKLATWPCVKSSIQLRALAIATRRTSRRLALIGVL